MPRITGKRGEVYLPTGDGISLSNQALTVSASKTIQGTTYTNQFYGTSTRTAWNRGKALSVRLQGIVGEATIYPSTTNNKVWVSPFRIYKDNGTVVTASTAQELTLTRDAAKEKIRELGGNVADSVSKATSFVVVGADAGSKAEKAQKLGIPQLSESEFLAIIKAAN